jgi:small GTP-binding protein
MSTEKNIELLNKKDNESDLTFKIIVIGDSFVGKSCLMIKAVKNIFDPEYKSTVGFEFLDYSINLENYNIKLQIWDTCGQETYRSLISSFYHSSALAILVYAINNLKSFENLEIWLNEIKSKGNPDINIILIGNKCDLENEREVTNDIVKEWCEIHNIKIYFETSAKNDINIDNIFYEAAKILLEQHKKIKNKIESTESMKNVLLDNKLYDKIKSQDSFITEGDATINQRSRRKCLC